MKTAHAASYANSSTSCTTEVRESFADSSTAEKVLRKFCEANRDALGFIPGAKLQISPFHQSIRFVGAELDIAEELVCQVIQSMRGKLGGTTLIFGDDGQTGRLRYAITKRIDARRQHAQAEWMKSIDYLSQSTSAGCYITEQYSKREPLQA